MKFNQETQFHLLCSWYRVGKAPHLMEGWELCGYQVPP